MLSPTEPWQVGNDFQWYTRAVYAIFDYHDMQDGVAWSVVWTRDEEEVAQENHLWDTEEDGQTGTRWAVLFNPEGLMLPSGEYVVSLYIQDELQDTVAFRIRFYPTPTPTPVRKS